MGTLSAAVPGGRPSDLREVAGGAHSGPNPGFTLVLAAKAGKGGWAFLVGTFFFASRRRRRMIFQAALIKSQTGRAESARASVEAKVGAASCASQVDVRSRRGGGK